MRLKKILIILLINILILLISPSTRAEGGGYHWEEYREEEAKQESSDENDISAYDAPSIGSDDKTSVKKKNDEQNEYGIICGMFSERGATIGWIYVNEDSGIQEGFDISVCKLYPSKEAEEKTSHWGIDLFALFPVAKPLYVGVGIGFYYEIFNSDDCNNYSGMVELQYLTEKFLLGYGYHRFKGYFIRTGLRI